MLSQKRNPSNKLEEIVAALKEEAKNSLNSGFIYFREDLKQKEVSLKKSVKCGAAANGSGPVIISGSAEKVAALTKFNTEIMGCQKCSLSKTRLNFVFGEGSADAKVVFVGEAPGADEDETGRPFIGRSGQLLTKIIESVNFKREDVFILNILKCRPPNNRAPEPDEIELCETYLKRQLDIIKPLIICTLGNPSTQTLLKTKEGITKLRGQIHSYNGIKLIATFHPSACLRNPAYKVDVWKDVKFLRKEYDRLCRSSN